MDIVIVDADRGARDLFSGMLTGLFPALQIRQSEDINGAVRMMAQDPPDLALIDFHSSDRPFDLLRDLRRLRVPCILLAREPDERLIVEALQIGALDFLAKSNVKRGYLKHVIARALIEVPRWLQVQDLMDTVPAEPAADRFRAELRRIVMDALGRGSRSSVDLEPGRTYNLIFQFCSVQSPAAAHMDEQARLNHMNLLLDRLGAIVTARGGILWTRKTDSNIVIFHESELVNAVLAAVESQSALLDFATRTYSERPSAIFAMESSEVVYTRERGELISEAINLTAHMAGKSDFRRGTLITESLFERLAPRARRYFFRVQAPFEGHTLYAFEYTA